MVNLLLFALDTNKQKMPTEQKNMIYNSLQLHLFQKYIIILPLLFYSLGEMGKIRFFFAFADKK